VTDPTNPVLDYASPSTEDVRTKDRASRNGNARMISSAIVSVGGLIAFECNTTHDVSGIALFWVGFVFLLVEFVRSYRDR
jgi:hypothetical protein